jgi:hypothetical protein
MLQLRWTLQRADHAMLELTSCLAGTWALLESSPKGHQFSTCEAS